MSIDGLIVFLLLMLIAHSGSILDHIDDTPKRRKGDRK